MTTPYAQVVWTCSACGEGKQFGGIPTAPTLECSVCGERYKWSLLGGPVTRYLHEGCGGDLTFFDVPGLGTHSVCQRCRQISKVVDRALEERVAALEEAVPSEALSQQAYRPTGPVAEAYRTELRRLTDYFVDKANAVIRALCGPTRRRRAKEMAEIRKLMGDKSSIYWRGDEAQNIQKRYRDLIEMDLPKKDRGAKPPTAEDDGGKLR